MIVIDNINKSYNGRTVLNIPDLSINKKEILGLVGNNGAGKTTLLRLMLDLIKPEKGGIKLNDVLNSKNEHWKSFTGSYLDESFLIDYLTPAEYFEFVGGLYSISTKQINMYLKPYEDFLGDEILSAENKYIRDFSSGNRQKIGIVAAMFISPLILILDEPFAHLDPTSQFRLSNLISRLNSYNGTTVIISSHNLEHISSVCSRIALLEEGEIINDFKNEQIDIDKLKTYFFS